MSKKLTSDRSAPPRVRSCSSESLGGSELLYLFLGTYDVWSESSMSSLWKLIPGGTTSLHWRGGSRFEAETAPMLNVVLPYNPPQCCAVFFESHCLHSTSY